jgi:sugar O-acyltransferase (sialic acid O-acetyltransferase NeuD family)
MKNLVLIGGGGHCHSVIDAIESQKAYNILGILDDNTSLKTVMSYPVLGNDSEIQQLVNNGCYFIITLGNIGKLQPRKKIIETIEYYKGKFATIISPYAYVSASATIGEGTVVLHHALINSNAIIGKHCIINSKALVEHDAKIGNNSHVATGSIINGSVEVGENCFIGSNATTKQNIMIADGVIVGAGSVIVKDLEESMAYAGIPAIPMRKYE